MQNVSQLISYLTTKAQVGDKLTIGSDSRTIKSVVNLTAKNYLEGNYLKVFFEEDGYLLVIPQDEEVYYSPVLQKHIKEIPDEVIGNETIITYKDKKYKLENKDDYQFVLQVLAGSPLDGEGEASFSDYFPVDGTKEFLSLGWMSYTGKRADLHCKLIAISEIEINQEQTL